MKKIGIIFHTDRPLIKETTERILNWAQSHDMDIYLCRELALRVGRADISVDAGDIWRVSDAIVTLGGDGSMLATARAYGAHGIPILGINLGKLGFLTEVAVNRIEDSLQRLMENDFEVEERMALEARFPGGDRAWLPALNDIVADHGGTMGLVKVDLYSKGEFVCPYEADGVIVSTPTGSTAYSLSVGGPIINPLMEAILVSPVSPHTLTLRSLVFPADCVLCLKAGSSDRTLRISLDGQVVGSLEFGEELEVRKAAYKLKLIKFKSRSFYEVLRTKLHWGARPLFNS